jgi:hypothetical protein
MKNVLFAFALLILVTGCNLAKHLTRDRVNASSQIESKVSMDSKLSKQTKTDIHNSVDTHTSETCDTNFLVPGSTLTGEKSLESLLTGGCFEIENNAVKGTIRLDTLSGNLRLSLEEKPRSFPCTFNRTTDTHQTTDQDIKENEDLKTSAANQTKASSDSQSSTIQKDAKRTIPWWWIPVAVCFVILVYFIVRFLLRTVKFKTGV